ncbi:replication factor A2 [Enteropsectra breve]|nr:replication factor A2 [Enteropsectra breve]
MNSEGFAANSEKQDYSAAKTIRNLTIKQINGVDSDEASTVQRIDGAAVGQVILCGFVVSVKTPSSGVAFELEDTTGRIECTFWLSGAYEQMVAERAAEGALLKVVGSLRAFNGRKVIYVTSITSVDMNHFIYHLTSALHQYCLNSGLIKNEPLPSTPAKGGSSMLEDDIMTTYRNNQDENGLELSVAINMLKSKYSENDIRSCINDLIENFRLYTVDGTSYRTTL